MTTEPTPLSTVRKVAVLALMSTAATLAMGLALSLLVGAPAAPAAEALVWAGLAALVALPLLNVVDLLVAEWRSKDWPFVAVAIVVLLLLGYTIADKLGG